MASFDKLTALQRDILREVFGMERGFYLTGGAALVGFYLGHRATDDLDLFTEHRDAFERGVAVLREACVRLGATLVTRRDEPGFRRLVANRGDEAVVVDLVFDPIPPAYPDKVERDGIRLDPPAEILVNKLNTVVSRAEIRDLVDIFYLERAGLRVDDALPHALAKDGGCTPATLAWVLADVRLTDDAAVPGGLSPAQVREFVQELVRRLRRLAFPGDASGSDPSACG